MSSPLSAASPLRIVLVVGQLNLGGTERQVALLAAGLRDAGHSVSVVMLFDAGPHAAALRDRGIEVLGPLAPGGGPLVPPRAAIRLYRILRQVRPDVVHAFLYETCVVAGPVGLLARVPVRVAGRRSLGDWKRGRPWVAVVERLINPTFHFFVANSEAVATDAVRRERLPVDRVTVIPNALGPEAFLPAELSADDPVRGGDRPAVLCVANLIDYKGHRFLLEAQRMLVKEGLTATLLLVGDGPVRHELEGQIRHDRLPTTLLGTRRDVTALLGQADIVVLPSLHEGMSNALMEAMAQGRPVVATDVGGNRETVGDAGVLCVPGDAAALAAALRPLLLDAPMRAALGSRARDRAKSEFGLERLIAAHAELYRRLLDGKGAPKGSSR